MKALILSAGQGSRLLPLTADRPKCLLPVGSCSVLEWQIRHLEACGISEVVVVVGFFVGGFFLCACVLTANVKRRANAKNVNFDKYLFVFISHWSNSKFIRKILS